MKMKPLVIYMLSALLLLCLFQEAAWSGTFTTFLGVPWKGTVAQMKKQYPDAAIAEKTKLISGKTFEDYRTQTTFEHMPMETAFLFYNNVLFRVMMRYKNYNENKVLEALTKLYGTGDGNSWKTIFTIDDKTVILMDLLDDTVTVTDGHLGTAWELDHQKTLQKNGHLGQYGGG
ncbi:MAG: hypothetical protein GWP07_00380 [Xanthomonadaceae bacterium]|nr:hypothetical protein [Xanthomonadaceae bacterium]